MTFKSLTLTLSLTSLSLYHIKISFREYKPLQKYSRHLTVVFHVDSNKTQNYIICNEKFTSLCTQQGHFHNQPVVLKDREIFQHHSKTFLLVWD